MGNETIAQRVQAWARRQPRAVLIPVAFIAIVVLLSLASVARRGFSRTALVPEHVPVAETVLRKPLPPAPVIKPPLALPVAATQPPAVVGGTAPAVVPAEAMRGTPPLVPQAMVKPTAPPAGIASGWVESSTFQRDQFGQLSQIEAAAEPAQLTEFQSENPARGGPDWAQKFQGWFKLDAPASISILRVAAGVGTVEATIDGQPLGQPLSLANEPASQTATLNLSKGWHTFLIQVSRGGFQGASTGIAVQIAVGDGTTSPMSVVPYAMPPVAVGDTNHPTDVPTSTPAKPSTAVAETGEGHE
ncbi:hypothetical protein [Rhodanobacter sp. DHB23]|uniref:hypothetical protein n=1 Tax=Rhodanobacter sp. DHB23 TaxID=2775923 RepID=UPI00177F5504|nr:hypothetical protein [Rhodanobacter sp. DHB23]MBD8872456.1 hypothetical protein [Rhodanobacter sp. DHB23]